MSSRWVVLEAKFVRSARDGDSVPVLVELIRLHAATTEDRKYVPSSWAGGGAFPDHPAVSQLRWVCRAPPGCGARTSACLGLSTSRNVFDTDERGFDEETGKTISANTCPNYAEEVRTAGGPIDCADCGVVLNDYLKTGQIPGTHHTPTSSNAPEETSRLPSVVG